MCDQTEMPYASGNVVWTKCQGIWWPGVVMTMEELPEEITRDFVKMPLLAVKYFNEDSYSYIRNHDSICLYNCRRKTEFIRKGLDHTNNKKKDSLQKFIEDIKLAENITGGDPDILERPEFIPETRPDYTAIFNKNRKSLSTNESGLKSSNSHRGKESLKRHSVPASTSNIVTPPSITHSRFQNNTEPYVHDSRIRIQATPKKVDKPLKQYTCIFCNFISPSMEGLVFHFKNHTESKHTLDYSCKKDTLILGKHKRSKQTKASSNAKDKFARRTQSPKPSTSKEGISPPEGKRPKKDETAREETNLMKPRNSNHKNKSEMTPLKNKSENADKKLASKNLFGKRKWQKSSNELENKSNKKKCEVEIRERLLADWDVDDATEQEEISPIKETSKSSPPNNTSESPIKQKATDCFDFDDSAGSILDSDLEERARKFAETRRIPTIPVLNTNCKFSPKQRLENSTSISEVLPSTQKHVTQDDNESRLNDTVEHFEDAVNSILSETTVPTIPKILTTICANDRSLNDTNNSTSSIVSCVDGISSHSRDPIQNICEDDQPVLNPTVEGNTVSNTLDSIQVKTAIDEIKNMDETIFVDGQTQDGHQSNITGQCSTNTDSADDVDSEINHVHGLKNGENQNSLKCGKNNDFINKSDKGGGSVSESAEHIRSTSLIKTSLPAQRDIFGAQAQTKKKHTSQDVIVDALKKDNYIIETNVLDDPLENPDDQILSTESPANNIQSHDSIFVESKVIVNMPIDVSRKDAVTGDFDNMINDDICRVSEGGEAINQDENSTNPVQNKERDIYSRVSVVQSNIAIETLTGTSDSLKEDKTMSTQVPSYLDNISKSTSENTSCVNIGKSTYTGDFSLDESKYASHTETSFQNNFISNSTVPKYPSTSKMTDKEITLDPSTSLEDLESAVLIANLTKHIIEDTDSETEIVYSSAENETLSCSVMDRMTTHSNKISILEEKSFNQGKAATSSGGSGCSELMIGSEVELECTPIKNLSLNNNTVDLHRSELNTTKNTSCDFDDLRDNEVKNHIIGTGIKNVQKDYETCPANVTLGNRENQSSVNLKTDISTFKNSGESLNNDNVVRKIGFKASEKDETRDKISVSGLKAEKYNFKKETVKSHYSTMKTEPLDIDYIDLKQKQINKNEKDECSILSKESEVLSCTYDTKLEKADPSVPPVVTLETKDTNSVLNNITDPIVPPVTVVENESTSIAINNLSNFIVPPVSTVGKEFTNMVVNYMVPSITAAEKKGTRLITNYILPSGTAAEKADPSIISNYVLPSVTTGAKESSSRIENYVDTFDINSLPIDFQDPYVPDSQGLPALTTAINTSSNQAITITSNSGKTSVLKPVTTTSGTTSKKVIGATYLIAKDGQSSPVRTLPISSSSKISKTINIPSSQSLLPKLQKRASGETYVVLSPSGQSAKFKPSSRNQKTITTTGSATQLQGNNVFLHIKSPSGSSKQTVTPLGMQPKQLTLGQPQNITGLQRIISKKGQVNPISPKTIFSVGGTPVRLVPTGGNQTLTMTRKTVKVIPNSQAVRTRPIIPATQPRTIVPATRTDTAGPSLQNMQRITVSSGNVGGKEPVTKVLLHSPLTKLPSGKMSIPSNFSQKHFGIVSASGQQKNTTRRISGSPGISGIIPVSQALKGKSLIQNVIVTQRNISTTQTPTSSGSLYGPQASITPIRKLQRKSLQLQTVKKPTMKQINRTTIEQIAKSNAILKLPTSTIEISMPGLQPMQSTITLAPSIQPNLQSSANVPSPVIIPSCSTSVIVSAPNPDVVVSTAANSQLIDGQSYVLVVPQYSNQPTLLAYDTNTGSSGDASASALYIDPSSLGSSGDLGNMILTLDPSSSTPSNADVVEETEIGGSSIFNVTNSVPSSRSNQDILAAALANTDVFQPDVSLQDTLAVVNNSQSMQGLESPAFLLPTLPSASVSETSNTRVPIMSSSEFRSNSQCSPHTPVTLQMTSLVSKSSIPMAPIHQSSNNTFKTLVSTSFSTSYRQPSMPLLTEDLFEQPAENKLSQPSANRPVIQSVQYEHELACGTSGDTISNVVGQEEGIIINPDSHDNVTSYVEISDSAGNSAKTQAEHFDSKLQETEVFQSSDDSADITNEHVKESASEERQSVFVSYSQEVIGNRLGNLSSAHSMPLLSDDPASGNR